jgi:predicted RND superfamily exporter protein
MKHDGPRATALGLTAALIICALAFGSLRLSVAAITSLLVGVVLMLGGLAWTRAMLNFSNFVVLPITFGISADYAINVLRRYQAEGSMSAQGALASTGGAVAMCSATTIIGFGSLLAAKNQALYSFGVFAVAGEVTMLATAALALPAVLALREQADRLTSQGPKHQGITQ